MKPWRNDTKLVFRPRSGLDLKGRRLVVLGLVLSLLSGCSLAPEYSKPSSPVPPDWPAGSAYSDAKTATAAPTAADLPWREFFTDARLRELIEMALRNNRDMRLAVLNAERARAYYGVQRAELWPSVNAAGSGSRERVPADLSSTGSARTNERYDVKLGVSSWEIDFFGRIRNLKDRALEEYLATDQARSGAQILLNSSVANI